MSLQSVNIAPICLLPFFHLFKRSCVFCAITALRRNAWKLSMQTPLCSYLSEDLELVPPHLFSYPAAKQMFPELLPATNSASISNYLLSGAPALSYRLACWEQSGEKTSRCLREIETKQRAWESQVIGTAPQPPKGALDRNLELERERRNLFPGNLQGSQPKSWKVDFLQAPSRKLYGALAAALTEHVQAALRMLCASPVRFLLRDLPCLLA